MNATQLRDRPQQTAKTTSTDVSRELMELATGQAKPESVLRQGFRVLARHFQAPFGLLQVDTPTGTLEDHLVWNDSHLKAWRKIADGVLLSVRYRNEPCARIYQAEQHDYAVFGIPLSYARQGSIGSMVLVAPLSDRDVIGYQLRELNSHAALLTRLADGMARPTSAPATGPTTPPASAGMMKAAGFQSVQEMAFHVVNQIKSKTGCEQVALGLVTGKRVRLLSFSGFDDLHVRSPGWRMVEQAMEECLDAQRIICHQNENHATDGGAGLSTGHRLHRLWHEQAGHAAVASIPLLDRGQCVAVVSLRQVADRVFRADQVKKIDEALQPLAQGLVLLSRAERSLVPHMRESLANAWQQYWHHNSPARSIVAALCCLLLVWVIAGRQHYIVSVPCTVVPATVRQVSAPFSGPLASCQVVPGASVRAGQLLATMETREIVLQQQRYLAEKRLAEIEMSRAAATRDLNGLAKAEARLQVANSQLELLESQQQRAEIRAPWDGLLLHGDLRGRVGEIFPLGERLFEMAPEGAWSVELKVPENAASYLARGQRGRFTTLARPHDATSCEVEFLEAASRNASGTNVFVARATIPDHAPPWLRGGMEGVARVDAGSFPVWWVWLHRMIDAVRIQVWKL